MRSQVKSLKQRRREIFHMPHGGIFHMPHGGRGETMWCRVWGPVLLLHARPWWPFGCTLAPQTYVCVETIWQPRRSPTASLVSEFERRNPKFAASNAWSHEPTPGAQLGGWLGGWMISIWKHCWFNSAFKWISWLVSKMYPSKCILDTLVSKWIQVQVCHETTSEPRRRPTDIRISWSEKWN